jgi:hypothetical protein
MTAVDLLLSHNTQLGYTLQEAYEMTKVIEPEWLYLIVNSKIKSGEIKLTPENLNVGTRITYLNEEGELMKGWVVKHYPNKSFGKTFWTGSQVAKYSDVISIEPPILNNEFDGSDFEYINSLFIPFMEKHKIKKGDKMYWIVFEFLTDKGKEKYKKDLEEIISKLGQYVYLITYMDLIPYIYNYVPPLEERIKNMDI